MIEGTLIAVGLFILGQVAKKWVVPKFGATGLHVLVFIAALAVVVVKGLMDSFPEFGALVLLAGKYFASAMVLYEVVWKRLNEKLNIA